MINIENNVVIVSFGEIIKEILVYIILWGVGVKVLIVFEIIFKCIGVELDCVGCVFVKKDLIIFGYFDIFVIGDLVNFFY